MKKIKLDKYEQEIENAIMNSKYIPVKDQENSILELREAATNYLKSKRKKSITLRVEYDSLSKMKVKSKRFNIPYQRVINLLIKGWTEDQIKLAI